MRVKDGVALNVKLSTTLNKNAVNEKQRRKVGKYITTSWRLALSQMYQK